MLTCLSLALFVGGALRQADLVNQNREASDQSAYLDYAKNLRTSHFQYVGDRNRMPVYPGLMALFYRQGMSDEQFFALGKRVGIGVALVVVIASFFILLRYVQFLEAFAVIQVAAFTVFAYKAPYIQADILFYGLAFALFILMIELLLRPRFTVAVAVGLVGGIAHLTKASVLPGIILCLMCLLARQVFESTEDLAPHSPQVDQRGKRWLRRLRPLLGACVAAVVFLLVIFPYIRTSRVRFGHYFYNVNSTFYVWYDSWDEVVSGTRAHGDRDGWPDMPPDKIPSMRKYLREHSVGQITARFVQGADVLRTAITKSYGYAPFVLLYFCLAVLLLCQNREHFMPLLRIKGVAVLLFFLLSYFAAYLALYAWYTPIVSGNRLVLSLFLPAMCVLVWVIDYASKRSLYFSICGRRIPASAGSPLVLMALLAYLLLTFPVQISRMPGGH